MDTTFVLTIITPDKIVYQGPVVSLVASCQKGYWGILAHHAPLAAHVVPGQITFTKPDGETVDWETRDHGFLEVADNQASLLLHSVGAR